MFLDVFCNLLLIFVPNETPGEKFSQSCSLKRPRKLLCCVRDYAKSFLKSVILIYALDFLNETPGERKNEMK